MTELSQELKRLAVGTALRDMMKKGYVNICTIDKCAELLGIHPKGSEAYQVLSTLHCVHFGEIPEPLRGNIPALLSACLSASISRELILTFPPGSLDPPSRRQRGIPVGTDWKAVNRKWSRPAAEKHPQQTHNSRV